MARPILGLISLIFIAGAIVLEFFIILSGAITSSPENLVYFLQADTGIRSAPSPARWTYWAVCGVDDNGHNTNCGSLVPALPFAPANYRNFDTTQGVPTEFLSRSYFYLSRFSWVFFLLALLFTAIALVTGLLSLCTRFGAYLSGLNAAIALFWQALAAALMTAWTVKARNVWRNNGREANLGRYGYGFVWATVALLFLAMITFCLAGGSSRKKERDTYVADSSRSRRRYPWQRRDRTVVKEYA